MEERVTPATAFLATGNTDRDSFRRALARSWDGEGRSPLAPAADAIHAALAPKGLTRLAAALAWIEVKNWTWFPMATEQFGLPRGANNPWAVKDARHPSGWAHYPDVVAAARAWAALVRDAAVFPRDWSLARFVARYAPQGDGNDPARYGDAAAAEIAALPLLPAAPPAAAGLWRPPIFDLARDADARRFGLEPGQRDRLLAKSYPGRWGARPEVIVLHVQDGVTPGSLAHWLSVEASSTVMIQKDGSVLRVIPEADGPWTNGEVTSVSPRVRKLMDRFGRDLNPVSLTIEAEGRPGDATPEPQLRAIVWQVRAWLTRYPWLTTERVVRHAEIDGINRANCPGPYYERAMAALAAAPLAPEPPRFPHLGVPEAVLRRAFPLADPDGPVTRYYLDAWAAKGLFPQFAWREAAGGWTYWSFPPFLIRANAAGRVEPVGGDAAEAAALGGGRRGGRS